MGAEIREKLKNKHREEKTVGTAGKLPQCIFFHNIPASSSRIIYWHTGAGGNKSSAQRSLHLFCTSLYQAFKCVGRSPLNCRCASPPSLCESNTRCKCDQRTLSHALISIHCEAGKAFCWRRKCHVHCTVGFGNQIQQFCPYSSQIVLG